MRQVLWRTFKRIALRQRLWNGNRERLRDILSRDPYHSIIVWTWTSYGPNRDRYEGAVSDPQWRHLRFIRLRSHKEMRRFVDGLGPYSVAAT